MASKTAKRETPRLMSEQAIKKTSNEYNPAVTYADPAIRISVRFAVDNRITLDVVPVPSEMAAHIKDVGERHVLMVFC